MSVNTKINRMPKNVRLNLCNFNLENILHSCIIFKHYFQTLKINQHISALMKFPLTSTRNSDNLKNDLQICHFHRIDNTISINLLGNKFTQDPTQSGREADRLKLNFTIVQT